MFNTTHGTLYFSNNQKHAITELKSISIEDGKLPDYVTRTYTPLSADAEVSLECEINGPLFEKLTGCNVAPCKTFDLELKSPYQVQVRTHKKKRINKKWAKRYGYKTMFRTVTMKDCEMETDGEHVDILGRVR